MKTMELTISVELHIDNNFIWNIILSWGLCCDYSARHFNYFSVRRKV